MWEMKFRGMGGRKRLSKEQPIQQQCYACDEMAYKFFVNDLDNPYTTPADKPFSWIRGRQVGGRSIMWGRQVYRWSDLDFEANAREGIGVDWPIRYADIAPWYDYVETFVGISGQAEGLPQLPDGKFLKPMALNCVEQSVRDAVGKAWPGERMVTIGRCAVLTEAHNGRADRVPHHLFDAVQRHRLEELPVGKLRQPFGLAGDPDELLDVVVPGRDVRVPNRPIDGDALTGVRLEVEIAPAIDLPAPHDRAPANLA